jgi:hypothetical protein
MHQKFFVHFATHLAEEVLRDGVLQAFRELLKQETQEANIRRIVSEPLRTAYDHLDDAVLQVNDVVRYRQHVENARLKFIEASHVDSPLRAAHGAFYAGVCFHLLGESMNELRWYERSLSMLVDEHNRRLKKNAIANGVLFLGPMVAPVWSLLREAVLTDEIVAVETAIEEAQTRHAQQFTECVS